MANCFFFLILKSTNVEWMLLSSDFVNISYKYFSKIYHFHVIVMLIGPLLVKEEIMPCMCNGPKS